MTLSLMLLDLLHLQDLDSVARRLGYVPRAWGSRQVLDRCPFTRCPGPLSEGYPRVILYVSANWQTTCCAGAGDAQSFAAAALGLWPSSDEACEEALARHRASLSALDRAAESRILSRRSRLELVDGELLAWAVKHAPEASALELTESLSAAAKRLAGPKRAANG